MGNIFFSWFRLLKQVFNIISNDITVNNNNSKDMSAFLFILSKYSDFLENHYENYQKELESEEIPSTKIKIPYVVWNKKKWGVKDKFSSDFHLNIYKTIELETSHFGNNSFPFLLLLLRVILVSFFLLFSLFTHCPLPSFSFFLSFFLTNSQRLENQKNIYQHVYQRQRLSFLPLFLPALLPLFPPSSFFSEPFLRALQGE